MHFVAILSAVHRPSAARSPLVCALTWLLAALIVMASIDRLPDPPAARRDNTQFKISSSHEQPANLTADSWSLTIATLQPLLERRYNLLPLAVSRYGKTLAL